MPPEPGDVLVTSLGTGLLYQLDPDLPLPVVPEPIPIGEDDSDPPLARFGLPRALAVDRNGLLLVIDSRSKTLERVDTSRDLRALAAQFSTVSSSLRGVVSTSDGRVFVVDPGIVPLVEPPLPPIRGITFLPLVDEVRVVSGITSIRIAGGCEVPELGKAACGNLFTPTGLAIANEDPELVLLVADAGEPAEDAPGRRHHGVIRLFPDRLFDPPGITDPNDPPYPAVGDGVNDELFCAPGPFATPRSLTVDRSPGHEGSVLVTDSGGEKPDGEIVPPRVYRVAATGCPDPDAVEIVAAGGLLVRPIGITVAEDGSIFVADATADRVVRIDPDTDPLDPDGNGTGTQSPFTAPASVDSAWDIQSYRAQPGPYFVAETSTSSLLRVDPALPARTTVSSGGSLVAPATLEVLPADAGLLVSDPASGAVIEVGLGGSQTVVSQGGRLSVPTSASRESTGTYLVTDLGDSNANPPIEPAVIRVDPTQPSPGNQTLVSEGGELFQPVAGAIDGSGFLIVADAGDGSAENLPRIVRISPSGDLGGLGDPVQNVLLEGTPLVSPVALALDETGSVILVADRGNATADPVKPPSVFRFARLAAPPGNAVHVGTFEGDLLESPAGIAVDSDRSILVTDAGDASTANDAIVIRLDALSGLQSFVAVGAAGETLDAPTGIGVVPPPAGAFPDQDADGITDAEDNCISVANRDQRDTDSPLDRIGNACDPDYDDNGAVGATDFTALRRAFGSTEGDPRYRPDIDVDGDGAIGALEFGFLHGCFSTIPGFSGELAFDATKVYCRPPLPAP